MGYAIYIAQVNAVRLSKLKPKAAPSIWTVTCVIIRRAWHQLSQPFLPLDGFFIYLTAAINVTEATAHACTRALSLCIYRLSLVSLSLFYSSSWSAVPFSFSTGTRPLKSPRPSCVFALLSTRVQVVVFQSSYLYRGVVYYNDADHSQVRGRSDEWEMSELSKLRSE